jgi:hypothetical protein
VSKKGIILRKNCFNIYPVSVKVINCSEIKLIEYKICVHILGRMSHSFHRLSKKSIFQKGYETLPLPKCKFNIILYPTGLGCATMDKIHLVKKRGSKATICKSRKAWQKFLIAVTTKI